MRIYKSFLLFLALALSLSSFSKEVSLSATKTVSVNFLSEALNITLSENDISNIQEVKYHNQLVFRAVNFKDNLAYVLVSAEDAAFPVLGYVTDQQFDTASFMPQALRNLLEDYSRQIIDIRAKNLTRTQEVIERWGQFSSSGIQKGVLTSMGPLVTTIWSQGCYFNDSCPSDPAGPCQHVVTGCVATAMAQVINYHNFPPNGSGQHSYLSNYGVLSADFGSTSYNWSLMADTLNSSTPAAKVAAVSQLISHCGISVDMMYSAGGSGAYSEDAMKAFVHYFNFDENLRMLYRDNFIDTVWEQMLRDELDSLQPVYYDGSGTGGHAFVCDGYQGNHYFHFNWGWNGSNNGYFLVTNLNPGGMNFGMYNSGVFGMKPRYPAACQTNTDTLTAPDGNFSDGSSYQDYQNNSSCSWLIQPQGAADIKLTFYTFSLNSGDTVKIFDGNSTSAPLIGAYYGDSLPPVVASSSNALFVLFQTDSALTSEGWSASYMTEFCQGITNLTGSSGQFSDGSGSYSYHNNTNCSWIISPISTTPIHLHFNSFMTEQGYDFVNVYDGTNTAATLLGSFSGQSLPSDLVATSGNMMVNFISDGGMVDEGWSASYYLCDTLPTPQLIGGNSFCEGDSIMMFTTASHDSIEWLNNTVILGNDTSLWAGNGGNYLYRIFRQGCGWDTSSTIQIIKNPLPQPNLGPDSIICSNYLWFYPGHIFCKPNNYSSWLWSTGDTTSVLLIDTAYSNLLDTVTRTFWVYVTDSNGCGNYDTINLFFDLCEGIEEPINQELIIYPNPTKDFIYWRIQRRNHNQILRLIDAQGRIIKEKNISKLSGKIDIGDLNSGLYILELKDKNTTVRKVVIKE